LRSLLLLGAVATALYCSGSHPDGPPEAPAAIALYDGDGQTAEAGTVVPLVPRVRVTSSSGAPVAGATVLFAVKSGAGAVTGASAQSNADGVAGPVRWTLGPGAGTQQLAATVTGLASVTFTATATAGAPASVTINAGNNQSATAGSAVAAAPSVIVRDANGNPVPGVTVSFAVASGGGSLTGAAPVTGANGIATVGNWTLGTTAGTNTLTATVSGLAPVTFTATGAAGAPASLTINSGNNQTATVGTQVPTPPSAIVRDANGNPVPNVAVGFLVATGGGSLTGGSATTNAAGIAAVGSWTLGAAAGSNTLTATVSGLAPVTFTATGVAGAAASVGIMAGNNQSATAGTAVATPPRVLVRDAANNPVVGLSVGFAVATGGGSVTGPTATTGADGTAAVGSWTLGASAGANTLTATVGGQAPVTFTATGTAGLPASLTINNGNNQSATSGSAVGIAPSVIVRDTHGNPVSGVTVNFAVASGGGSLSGATPLTGANGIAMVGSWTLGTTAGGNTLTATAGLLGPVTFTATGAAGAPASLTINGGNTQTATAGTAVSIAPSVIVRDANSNPVPSVTVSFAVASGGGSLLSGSPLSGANGIATVGSWTLGTTAGANTLTATVGGLPPVTFTATGVASTSAYDIDLLPVGFLTARQLQAFTSAVTRWRQIVTGDLSDIPQLSISLGSCVAWQPAITNRFVDDLLIFVTVRTGDGAGGVLASAGPCVVRGSNQLPAAGFIQLDIADVASMEANGTLDDVVLHEMGHVLGIGTVWEVKGLLTGARTADPVFTGPAAIAGYVSVGAAAGPVPVENTGGAGTRDAHWRESALGNELMTGFVGTSPMPLSLVTVGSLTDMGYVANNSAADPYRLTGALRAGAATPATGPWEDLTTPITVVDDSRPAGPR
jgi:adhesin/invasin